MACSEILWEEILFSPQTQIASRHPCETLTLDIQLTNRLRSFQLSKADIVAPNLEAQALYIDYWILGDASREFPEDSWVRTRC